MRFLPHIIQDTMAQFTPKELAIHLKEFILNLPPDRLVKQKLECLRDFVQSDIFTVRGRWPYNTEVFFSATFIA